MSKKKNNEEVDTPEVPTEEITDAPEDAPDETEEVETEVEETEEIETPEEEPVAEKTPVDDDSKKKLGIKINKLLVEAKDLALEVADDVATKGIRKAIAHLGSARDNLLRG